MNIYIIKNDSFYKIGKANCVANRLSVLQTGSSSKLNLVAIKPSKEAVLIEHEIHSYLSENRVRGEWFLLNDLELNDVILRFGFCTNFPISS